MRYTAPWELHPAWKVSSSIQNCRRTLVPSSGAQPSAWSRRNVRSARKSARSPCAGSERPPQATAPNSKHAPTDTRITEGLIARRIAGRHDWNHCSQTFLGEPSPSAANPRVRTGTRGPEPCSTHTTELTCTTQVRAAPGSRRQKVSSDPQTIRYRIAFPHFGIGPRGPNDTSRRACRRRRGMV
jgi:hypothetical protein